MDRILVVDDEISIRKALKLGLASNEIEVDSASDGESGIRLGQERSYDVLITDLCLPDINGLEVIERIKHTSPDIIPIVITGRGSMNSSLKAIRLEVSDYLEKPLDLSTIKDSVARGLQRRAKKIAAVEKKVNQVAVCDTLTALPGRAVFRDRLNHAIDQCRRNAGRSFAVFIIDIDLFKDINDAYGHNVGDKVLVEFARRLQTSIRAGDTVARLSGNEFAVLVRDLADHQAVIEFVEKCRRLLEAPIHIGDIKLNLSTSIGVVLKTHFYKSSDNVLRDAEIVLARCKSDGRGQIKAFENSMLEQDIAALRLENDLRLSLPKQEFEIYYQPILRLENRRLNGFEALIRWNHPEHGVVYPNKFIPIAEKNGLINQIGYWMIKKGGRQLKKWQSARPGCERLTLNINISGSQFMQSGFTVNVLESIREIDIDPQSLKLELTESVLMEDSRKSIGILKQIKAIGIKLAIDDFGTGYSSLAYLQQFPLDELKIDSFFTKQLTADTECSEIVKAIVALAKKLNLNVVAEGIEHEEQMLRLQELGCDMVQGYLFSKPVPAQAVDTIIDRYL